MSRLPMIDENRLTDEQRHALMTVAAGGKRIPTRGPFPALLRSPELCERAAQLGEFLRFGTSLPPRLSEMAILITARVWRAGYEWQAHAPLARQGGLADESIEAILAGRRPATMQADEAALYDLCTELHDTRRVSDAAYRMAVDAFGERGVIEILGICGYYALVSMVLNTAEVALPDDAGDPFPKE